MAASELSKSMNEFLTKLQDDLKEAMNTMMCTKCEGKHKYGLKVKKKYYTARLGKGMRVKSRILTPVLSSARYFLRECSLLFLLILCFCPLGLVGAAGALRWTASLMKRVSVLSVINDTALRRETCGPSPACSA